MTISSAWQYDELIHVGTNYNDISEVEAYDIRHSKFRDVKRENDEILDALSIQQNHTVIEIGTGTGAFAIQAARRCKKVYAIDISQAMLDYAKSKADALGISNIIFCQGGFLTYSHDDTLADVIVTSLALHHLPDFWKAIALRRLNGMLKASGQLFINDVIFPNEDSEEAITEWIRNAAKIHGRELANETKMHFQKEYSTFRWIMEGLLERAGFKIESKIHHENIFTKYICTKISNHV
jgi:ubiquinone/menaquinone biosynthesis C-methylase UbiE